jgi:hypothetical protein
MGKKKLARLPNSIFEIKNKDKVGTQEKWSKNRNLANFPKIFKMLIVGPPNRGKSLLAKHLILRMKPRFDEIYLCHIDPDTEEWLDIIDKDHMLQEIPDIDYFADDRRSKKLIILEDWETDPKDQNLSNLFRYTSSHLNLSVMLLYQNWSSVIPLCRRLCNIFYIWPLIDKSSSSQFAKRVGLTPEELHKMYELCKSDYDSICIDLTVGSPAKYRLNTWHKLTKVEE